MCNFKTEKSRLIEGYFTPMTEYRACVIKLAMLKKKTETIIKSILQTAQKNTILFVQFNEIQILNTIFNIIANKKQYVNSYL